jgi:hypothetical protein
MLFLIRRFSQVAIINVVSKQPRTFMTWNLYFYKIYSCIKCYDPLNYICYIKSNMLQWNENFSATLENVAFLSAYLFTNVWEWKEWEAGNYGELIFKQKHNFLIYYIKLPPPFSNLENDCVWRSSPALKCSVPGLTMLSSQFLHPIFVPHNFFLSLSLYFLFVWLAHVLYVHTYIWWKILSIFSFENCNQKLN